MENRKHERHRVFIRINVYKYGQLSESGRGYITDISQPGLRIESNFLLDEGTVAVLDFTKHDKTSGNLYGKIIRRKHLGMDFYEYGIELLKESIIFPGNLEYYFSISTNKSREK